MAENLLYFQIFSCFNQKQEISFQHVVITYRLWNNWHLFYQSFLWIGTRYLFVKVSAETHRCKLIPLWGIPPTTDHKMSMEKCFSNKFWQIIFFKVGEEFRPCNLPIEKDAIYSVVPWITIVNRGSEYTWGSKITQDSESKVIPNH